MSNVFGAGKKLIPTGNVSPTQQQDARPDLSRRPAPFMLRILKFVGLFFLTILLFRLLGLLGILVVALGVVGFFYIDKKTTLASKNMKRLIATGVVSKVAKIVGVVLAMGGVIFAVEGVMRSSLQPIIPGVCAVVAGIIVWIISYRLRP